MEHIVDVYWETHKLNKSGIRLRADRKEYLNVINARNAFPKRYEKAFGSNRNIFGGALALSLILFRKLI